MEMIQRWPQRDQFVGQMDLSCKHAKKSQLPPEASAAARECSGGGSIIPIRQLNTKAVPVLRAGIQVPHVHLCFFLH